MRKLQQYQLDEEKHPAYNIHSGEDLQDELASRHLTQKALADLIGSKPSMLNEIIKGKRSITSQIALRQDAGLGIRRDYWLKGQRLYDLCKARRENQETIANIREKQESHDRKEMHSADWNINYHKFLKITLINDEHHLLLQ